jgi:hypothetical protein
MNPLNPKKLLAPVLMAAAGAAILTAPLAHAGGGGGGGGGGGAAVAPAAQVGTDLAVVLIPTAASPGTQGFVNYINIPGTLSLQVELKGVSVAGAPVSGPVQLRLTTKSLDCATATSAVIDGVTLDAKGQAKFQSSTPPALTGLEKSRTTLSVVSMAPATSGTSVAQYIPEPCIPGIL